MKNITYQSQAMRDLFKTELQNRSWSYTVLAKKINVSLPTIKRWMTDDDIPFEKVLQILEVFNLSIQDLSAKLTFDSIPARPELSKKDEEFLVQNPQDAYVLLLVSLGFTFQEIASELKLSVTQLEKHLLSLEKNNLIRSTENRKVHSLLKPPIQWAPHGSFARRYFPHLIQDIAEQARERQRKVSPQKDFSSELLEFGETYMSEQLREEFLLELEKIIKRYKELTRLERPKIGISKCQPVSFLVFASQYSCWKNVMWKTKA